MEDGRWEKQIAFCHSVNAIDKIDLVGILQPILTCYFRV